MLVRDKKQIEKSPESQMYLQLTPTEFYEFINTKRKYSGDISTEDKVRISSGPPRINLTNTEPLSTFSRRLFHFPFNIKGKSNDALSFNLSTMPGCAGYYGKPIEEWIRQGYSCQECAWEKICLESSEKDKQLRSKQKEHLDIDLQVEKVITE